jgi:adenine-specific DNA-methyltransferase
LNDRPRIFGKTARREDASDTVSPSVFEEFRRNTKTGRFLCVDAIDRLLRNTRARWVVLSYSSGGRATAGELNDVLCANGKVVEVVELGHKKHVMAGMSWTNEWLKETAAPNREFLFLLERN